jgi:hypothetical protein
MGCDVRCEHTDELGADARWARSVFTGAERIAVVEAAGGLAEEASSQMTGWTSA